MSPGQTGHITGQMGRVPGTDGTHTKGCPAKILSVYCFFFSPHQFALSKFYCRGVAHEKTAFFKNDFPLFPQGPPPQKRKFYFYCRRAVSEKQIRDGKGTTKNLCDEDFAELAGELSGVICGQTLVY